jgi:hypothetical protein
VVNNTIWHPTKWAIRILQETVGPPFLACSLNAFINNIVVVTNAAANPTINVGPNTAPETFDFSNNLWFNDQSGTWSGPNLPVQETGGMLNRDPRLADPANGDFTIPLNSPAVGVGRSAPEAPYDFFGRRFVIPPSIGAVEGNPGSTGMDEPASAQRMTVRAFPNPSNGENVVLQLSSLPADARVRIIDVRGRTIHEEMVARSTASLRVPALAPGIYTVACDAGGQAAYARLLVVR